MESMRNHSYQCTATSGPVGGKQKCTPYYGLEEGWTVLGKWWEVLVASHVWITIFQPFNLNPLQLFLLKTILHQEGKGSEVLLGLLPRGKNINERNTILQWMCTISCNECLNYNRLAVLDLIWALLSVADKGVKYFETPVRTTLLKLYSQTPCLSQPTCGVSLGFEAHSFKVLFWFSWLMHHPEVALIPLHARGGVLSTVVQACFSFLWRILSFLELYIVRLFNI